ncbi:Hypothetical predicted protein [Paramuricea clavata]|uniref:P2X purinoreceptor 7 intracellular domain-containing protein n=1 Tax=Paramuricea clavata TaxID=317549 RepID=A0A6S7HNB9_PARCT|nr:Hypothetical predicted protein [Paramuricea clavata]
MFSTLFESEKIPDELLMESFLGYVSKDERELINTAIKDDDLNDSQEKEWLDFLKRFDCRTIPKKEDRQTIILELAHKEMVQIAQFIIDSWRKPFKENLANRDAFSSMESLEEIYQNARPTVKRVLNLIRSEPTISAAEGINRLSKSRSILKLRSDDKWLQNYNRQERERLELQEKLGRRLDGSVEVSEWCNCGNCDITLLTNNSECYCCFEQEGCEEAMNREEVIQDLKAEGVQNAKCVTQHPGFNPVCLQKWSLKMAADRYKTKDKSKYSQTSTENSFLRSISYREFTRLIYGLLGNRRIPLPACAYIAIRNTFPIMEKEGQFTGYSDDSD